MQVGRGFEPEFFQALARQGHAGGRPGTTQQGIYCYAPSGELLGSDNTRDPDRLLRLLNSALAKWQQLSRAQKLMPRLPIPQEAPPRSESCYPTDGLVLRQYTRDLGEKRRGLGDNDRPWNSDMVWFRAEEAKAMVPMPQLGARRDVPAHLVRRLARLHLIDHVLGTGRTFQDRSVSKATMTLEVTAVGSDKVELRITGASQAAEGERGIDAQWLGKATWVPSQSRFSHWEMLAVGTRQGSGVRAPYIRNDTGSGSIGFAFLLATDAPLDRVAPSAFPAYGWAR